MRASGISRASDFSGSISYLQDILPLVQDVSASSDYLISLGILQNISYHKRFSDVIKSKYPIMGKKPIVATEINSVIGNLKLKKPIFRYVKNEMETFNASQEVVEMFPKDMIYIVPNAIDIDLFKNVSEDAGLKEGDAVNIWNKFDNLSEDPLQYIYENYSWVSKIQEIFDKNKLSSLGINSVGIAIAHAFLEGEHGFEAPLSLWVK